jgi:glutaredoxin
MWRIYEHWRKRRRARQFAVVLYTRHECGLCDKAYDALVSHGFRPVVVDIDRQPRLVEKYGNCVPVVMIDGKLRFRGHVNLTLLRRFLVAGGLGSNRSIKSDNSVNEYGA